MSLRKSHILKSSKIKIGITMGDPSGIGPEIIAKSFDELSRFGDIVIIGDAWVLAKHKAKIPKHKISLIDLNNVVRKNFRFGQARAEYGRASIEYVDAALDLIKHGYIDCLVTCPISKKAVSESGLSGFSGHTSYLVRKVSAKKHAMMLLNRYMRFSLVTEHLPVKFVSKNLSSVKIADNIDITLEALKEMFLIKKPRLAVSALNPHASDNGLLGEEEQEIICPALRRARKNNPGSIIDGPLPADIAASLGRSEYDCIIAMYHDQALIPLKLSDPSTGVNLTLGLGFVRTSPLHGVAFDIAGKFIASPASLIQSVRTSVLCTSNLRKS